MRLSPLFWSETGLSLKNPPPSSRVSNIAENTRESPFYCQQGDKAIKPFALYMFVGQRLPLRCPGIPGTDLATGRPGILKSPTQIS